MYAGVLQDSKSREAVAAAEQDHRAAVSTIAASQQRLVASRHTLSLIQANYYSRPVSVVGLRL